MELILYPDPALRHPCAPVERFDSALENLAAEMLQFMKKHHGIGLAAPQIGISTRLFVCKAGKSPLIVINPSIEEEDEEAEMVEGCLSLPGRNCSVIRKKRIHLSCCDLSGQACHYTLTDLAARVVQHETDHLNGILIDDYRREPGTPPSPGHGLGHWIGKLRGQSC